MANAATDYKELLKKLPNFALVEISAICIIIGIVFTFFLIRHGRSNEKRSFVCEIILSICASCWLGIGTYILVNSSLIKESGSPGAKHDEL